VLLKGHPLPQPLLGESRAHSLLSLVLNPKHVCSTPLTLSDWQLGARTVDTSDQRIVHLPGYRCTECPRLVFMSGICGSTQAVRALPPRGSLYYQHLFLLQNSLHTTMDARGPAINVSNSGGGRCQTYCQQPLGDPPLTSPTSVVATAGPAANTP
jgi:hypothetical protein